MFKIGNKEENPTPPLFELGKISEWWRDSESVRIANEFFNYDDGTEERLDKWIPTWIARHCRGDWGNVDEATRSANEKALREAGAIISEWQYLENVGVKITTSADRSRTSISLFLIHQSAR